MRILLKKLNVKSRPWGGSFVLSFLLFVELFIQERKLLKVLPWDKSNSNYAKQMVKTSKSLFGKPLSPTNTDDLSKIEAKRIEKELIGQYCR